MTATNLERNADGTWTARIFSSSFTGTYNECLAWLRANGEEA